MPYCSLLSNLSILKNSNSEDFIKTSKYSESSQYFFPKKCQATQAISDFMKFYNTSNFLFGFSKYKSIFYESKKLKNIFSKI